jgi:hypothetical protein
MKGVWRLAIAVGTGAIALAPAPLAAQSTPGATSNTPATDAVGPRELQNFRLSGNVTHPADQQAAPPPAQGQAPTRTAAPAAEQIAAPRQRTKVAEVRKPLRSVAASAALAAPVPQTSIASKASALPQTELPTATAGTALPSAALNSPAQQESTGTSLSIEPEHHLLLWPWLLAVLLAAMAGAFFVLRGRSRHAFAGGPQTDLFSAPESAPAPPPAARAPRPEPAPAPPAKPVAKSLPAGGVVSTGLRPTGVVSTSLRPWLDVAIQPVRCIVDESKVTIEFELELYNSGTAAARAILVEAMAFNAGPTQDQEIGAFFGKPTGEGDRIDAIPPLQRISLHTQVVAPRENVIILDAGGRQVFVPLIAFNALYEWNGREGQTSVSYLLGRETDGEKMAPFRVDLGPRQYRKVGAHPLPARVRK